MLDYNHASSALRIIIHQHGTQGETTIVVADMCSSNPVLQLRAMQRKVNLFVTIPIICFKWNQHNNECSHKAQLPRQLFSKVSDLGQD